jgi:hypothetical protein
MMNETPIIRLPTNPLYVGTGRTQGSWELGYARNPMGSRNDLYSYNIEQTRLSHTANGFLLRQTPVPEDITDRFARFFNQGRPIFFAKTFGACVLMYFHILRKKPG